VALHHRAHLQAGETVLVLGATGGVGSTAVQLAAAAGATVIAVAGGEDKVAFARSLGAHHTVDHRREDLRTRVLELTDGEGVDIVYDAVGGEQGDQARRLLAWEGRLLVIGFASGGIPSYPANHILVKNYSVIGLHWGAYTEHGRRDLWESTHEDLLRLYRDGAIVPPIQQEVALDGIAAGLARLEDRAVLGRVVYVERAGP
jgi:NADPH2:quinone reductase